MPLVGIGAAVGGIGSLLGGIFGSSAAKKAAAQQQAGAERAAATIGNATTAAQQGMGEAVGTANTRLGEVYNQQTNAINPYLSAGETGLSGLLSALQPGGELTNRFSFNPTDIENSPEFQFQQKQGTQAVQRAAAAQGSSLGGGTLKALSQYNQGLASTSYQNAFTNALNSFNTNRTAALQPLQTLIGVGQTGLGQFNQAAQNYGNNTANNTMSGAQFSGSTGMQGAFGQAQAYEGGANAGAAGTVGAANAWNSALSGIGNSAQSIGLLSMLKPPAAPSGYGYGGAYGAGII